MTQQVDARFARGFLERLLVAVMRHTVVLDMLALARQIGAVPEIGSLAGRIGTRLQHVAAYRARQRAGSH